MQKKIIKYGALYCCLLFLSGCSLGEVQVEQVVEMRQTVEVVESKVQDKEKVTEQKMKLFFDKFLSLGEETILVLNQKPKIIGNEYWSAYRTYQDKTSEILGSYLSSATKKRLEEQYIHDDFHYFRLIEINDYMITGVSGIEDVKIISKDLNNNKNIYEVMVTAKAKVLDQEIANRIYTWDTNKGYYTKKVQTENSQFDIDSTSDEIRIKLNYWVEISDDEILEINSVKEKSNISLGLDERLNAKNNYFIGRIPYQEEVIQKHQDKIYKFVDLFMKQEYNFYKHYEKAYNTSYDSFKTVIANDLGLKNAVTLKEKNYKDSFDPIIIPLKDNMNLLEFDVKEDVTVIPHVSSSKKYPTYEVKIKADVSLVDGKNISYEYTYLFTFEDGMISKIRFITQNQDDAISSSKAEL